MPKLAEPFSTAPPTLILDPVFLIQIDSHVVLFIDVYLLKYSYLETRSRCVNTSYIIVPIWIIWHLALPAFIRMSEKACQGQTL